MADADGRQTAGYPPRPFVDFTPGVPNRVWGSPVTMPFAL
ncbi:hypothetical protein I547_3409 [Mycobacterium kansasii 824]|nr:hypothetical protein I547_3409 [Mycobacterium kansasii 824]